MVNEITLKLLKMLRDKTVKGILKWKPTIHINTYDLNLPNATFSISKRDEDIVLMIFNEDSVEINTVTDTDLQEQVENSFQFMLNLFEYAKASAFHIDDALEKIFDDLSDLK